LKHVRISELGKDDAALQQQGLSLQKDPLFVSVVDGCETLKALVYKVQIILRPLQAAKASLCAHRSMYVHALTCMHVLKNHHLCNLDLYAITSHVSCILALGISVTQGYGLVSTPGRSIPRWVVRAGCGSNLAHWA